MDRVRRILARLWQRVRDRPVRVATAVLALAAALGYTIEPEAREAILTLVGVLAPVAVGGEAIQARRRAKRQPRDQQGQFASKENS